MHMNISLEVAPIFLFARNKKNVCMHSFDVFPWAKCVCGTELVRGFFFVAVVAVVAVVVVIVKMEFLLGDAEISFVIYTALT